MAPPQVTTIALSQTFIQEGAVTPSGTGFGIPSDRTEITYAPGLVDPLPPVYSAWSDIERIVNKFQGNAKVLVDARGTSSGRAQVPATANLDGNGRLQIIGVGPEGETQLEILDGGQIKNVQSFRTIVVRATPTIRPTILYTLSGMVVDTRDANFLFGGVTTTPIIQVDADSVPGNQYIVMFLENGGFLNQSHNPGNAVLNAGDNVVLLLAMFDNLFPSPYDQTISGPASATLQLQFDSTQADFTHTNFLGGVSVTRVDDAKNLPYVPASNANWNNSPPATVAAALDRIAAHVGPIP